ncbi:MAG: hypothetical protein CL610_14640 [Anaerolineaceae bacterium]|nr:hypothetical protein [Anaerolineaceae bacterium]
MGIPDNHLDNMIVLALETKTHVARRQKLTAWEQLHRRAARQVMMAPYAIPPKPALKPSVFYVRWARRLVRMLHIIFTDDTVYDRAARKRCLMPVWGSIGGTVVVHFSPPLRAH